MDWVSLFQTVTTSIGAIGGTLAAVITNSHSQKLKNIVAQVTPIAQGVNAVVTAAAPLATQVQTALQAHQTTLEKIQSVEQAVTPILGATGPQGVAIGELLQVLTATVGRLVDATKANQSPALVSSVPVPVVGAAPTSTRVPAS